MHGRGRNLNLGQMMDGAVPGIRAKTGCGLSQVKAETGPEALSLGSGPEPKVWARTGPWP